MGFSTVVLWAMRALLAATGCVVISITESSMP